MNAPSDSAARAPAPFRQDLIRWRQLVTPAWLDALARGRAAAAPTGRWCLFEVGFGTGAQFERAHIPGAAYIDTAELEVQPLWNKVSDQALLRFLLRNGIRHDTTVIVYGRATLAAARAAHLLLYAGVADVRLLDGGFEAWQAAGLALASGPAAKPVPVADFGVRCPARPDFMIGTEQARQLLRQSDGALVSIRTWDEFVGNCSGYSYIAAKGDIPGARWGRAGMDGDVNSMSEFHNADASMRGADEIGAMWRTCGVHEGQQTAFYCGTGWRASLAFFYAWLMAWERISVYDGGWCEWSGDPGNPVAYRGDLPAAA